MKDSGWMFLAVGVGGYFLWQWWKSQPQNIAPSAAAPPAGGTTPTLQQISVITPAGGGEPTAGQLQNQLNRLTATATDWNGAYTTLTGGRSIDSLYGFNFNSVYGSQGNNTITASTFLAMAKATGLTPHISLTGFGRTYGPVYQQPYYRYVVRH
jgi:hypothetical protein